MPRVRSARESGQAAVESALVLPLMIFLCLGIIQLTMIENAKIMTKYAAFNAARAGIVWNGNNERMHDAAIFSLLPTMGNTSTLGKLILTWGKAELLDSALGAVNLSHFSKRLPGANALSLNNVLGQVRVDTVSPGYWTPIGSVWNLPWGANWKELDFDGPATYPEVPDYVRKIAEFFDLKPPDDKTTRYREATLLVIRVRYWYRLRIPFANRIIFLSWFAANAGRQLYGEIGRSTLTKSNMLNKTSNVNALEFEGRGIKTQRGYDTVYPLEMQMLWRFANGTLPLGISNIVGKKFFIPLSATYTMRMQSDFYRKWVMHFNSNEGM